jgi:hypothetical protein
MCFPARRTPAYSLPSLALLILAAVSLQGCPGQSSTAREQEFLKNNPKNAPKEAVAKFAGHVTVDGLPQLGTDQLFIFLADPQHLEPKKIAKYSTTCKPDGSFEFMTYFPGDGVPVGKYIVGFVALRALAKLGGRADQPVPFRGPDGLKNRYNDPDKNKDIKEFVVDVTEPGRTDYEFNLTLAGKDPGMAGEHTVKTLGEAPADL